MNVNHLRRLRRWMQWHVSRPIRLRPGLRLRGMIFHGQFLDDNREQKGSFVASHGAGRERRRGTLFDTFIL